MRDVRSGVVSSCVAFPRDRTLNLLRWDAGGGGELGRGEPRQLARQLCPGRRGGGACERAAERLLRRSSVNDGMGDA